jgi:hypothetical protein
MTPIRQLAAVIAQTLDPRDLALTAGLGLMGYGLNQIYPPAAFIVPGAVLTYIAVFGVR